MPDCAVMLHSLLENNSDESFEIHFLHERRQTADQVAGLAEIAERFGASWSPHLIGDHLLAPLPFAPHYGGYAACFRLLLPQLLPGTPKVLYLDADVLIVDRVRPLWETELGDCCVAAVTNSLFKHMERRVQQTLGLPDGRAYFNSGVLLLDLDALRRTGLDKELLAFASQRHTPLPWPDQDVLNAVLWRRRKPLHPRWNATNGMFDLPWRYLPWSKQDLIEATRHPAIVHFVGAYKPRHFRLRHPFRDLYFQHLAKTRWKDLNLEGRTLRHRLMRPLPVLWQWKIEELEKTVPELARRLLPPQSLPGRLVRDVYRLLTPRKRRAAVPLILEALASAQKEVFFIQVGSNDATHGDPLRPFILSRPWSGIMIEPVPYVFERLRANYQGNPRLKLENVAIAPREGHADFYYLAQSNEQLPVWYDQLGSFSLQTILKHADVIPNLEQRLVKTAVASTSFEALCAKHRVGVVDLVHIDTEGYDFEIVKLIDFDTHRPKILLYEHRHLSSADRDACRAHLVSRGYACAEDGADTICVRLEAISNPWSRLAYTWRLLEQGRGRPNLFEDRGH